MIVESTSSKEAHSLLDNNDRLVAAFISLFFLSLSSFGECYIDIANQ